VSPIHPDRLIEALDALDPARRAVLELRYLHGFPPEQIAELLDRAPGTVQELIEEAVERLVVTLDVDSLDQGVTLILILTELPPGAWGNRPAEAVATLARKELDRGSQSGGAQEWGA
jgi:arginase family enzyme